MYAGNLRKDWRERELSALESANHELPPRQRCGNFHSKAGPQRKLGLWKQTVSACSTQQSHTQDRLLADSRQIYVHIMIKAKLRLQHQLLMKANQDKDSY
eukprot:3497-Amphidinium_carterae.1